MNYKVRCASAASLLFWKGLQGPSFVGMPRLVTRHVQTVAGSALPRQRSSFHRRELPCPPAIAAFSSEEGRKIMKEALRAGTAEGSFRLLEQFRTQDEPAYCGLGTLVMVLNALDIDPGRIWKGVWRWFNEAMLDCCEPLEVVQQEGIVFEKFCCLAACNGAVVKAHRPDDEQETLEVFRQRLREAVSDAHGAVFVVSYSRKAFGQSGDGHYSPIAAYHEELDAALILDVARFKLPPHWVPVTLLWEALKYKDSATGRCRGYALLSKKGGDAWHHRYHEGYILTFGLPPWRNLASALAATKASLEEEKSVGSLSEACHQLKHHLGRFGGIVCECPDGTCHSQHEDVAKLAAEVLEQLNAAECIDASSPWRQAHHSDGKQRLFAADVLALPPGLWLPESVLERPWSKALDTSSMPTRLAAEISRLREQLQIAISYSH